MQDRRIGFIVIGVLLLILAFTSGNTGSMVIGLVLGAIALYVGLSGKVHPKFTRNPRKDGKTYEDEQLMQLKERIQGKRIEENAAD